MGNPVYKSLKCIHCGGRIEAVEFNDVVTMRIDGTMHKVPMYRVPANRCFDCSESYVDGTSDESMEFWTQHYLTGIGRNKWYHKLRRRWRAYCNRWRGWYWNRSPWARRRQRRERERAA
jgi:hypothetical protein